MTLAIAFSRAAALCLLAGAAHATTVPAARPDAPVPATRYQPTAYQAPPPEPTTPDRVWREQNRIVAAYDSMMLTMPGDTAHAHAGHGQHGAAQAAADPHAAHKTQAPAADPHAGHRMGGAAAADPHAGHHMHTAAQAGPVARFVAASNAGAGTKTGCACCKGKEGAGDAGSCMAPGAGHDAHAGMAHGAASKTDCSCCKGKDGAQGAASCMAPGAGHGAHGAAGSGKGQAAGAMKDGCCKGDCCKESSCKMAAAPGAHQHGGQH